MHKLVDASAIARRFGVTVATIHTWTRQGRIPCIRPTHSTVRYSIEAVERALMRPARSAAAQPTEAVTP